MFLNSRNAVQSYLSDVQETIEKTIAIEKGVLVALTIFGSWLTSLVLLLTCIDVPSMPPALKYAMLVWQTFLYTGLFINAHDAMHGAVAPKDPKVNNFIGAVSIACYALFAYKSLIRTHWLHHQHPASETDPDYHKGNEIGNAIANVLGDKAGNTIANAVFKNPIAWYLQFMFSYWSWARIAGLVAIFHILHRLFNIPEANLVWFWMIPSIASSVQLFFFGTYLPHREPEGGYTTDDRAQSTNWSTFWSFVSCYHFGYHLEHHENPHVPWWKLPEVHHGKRS